MGTNIVWKKEIKPSHFKIGKRYYNNREWQKLHRVWDSNPGSRYQETNTWQLSQTDNYTLAIQFKLLGRSLWKVSTFIIFCCFFPYFFTKITCCSYVKVHLNLISRECHKILLRKCIKWYYVIMGTPMRTKTLAGQRHTVACQGAGVREVRGSKPLAKSGHLWSSKAQRKMSPHFQCTRGYQQVLDITQK